MNKCKVISFVRIDKNNKVYGWFYDLDHLDKEHKIKIVSDNRQNIVPANRPLPSWADSLIISSGVSKKILKSLPRDKGYFEYILKRSPLSSTSYAEVKATNNQSGIELRGSPFIIYSRHDCNEKGQQSLKGIPDEKIEHLFLKELILRIEKAQSEGKPIIIHPPFISWNISLFQRPQHMALSLAKAGAISIFFTNNVFDNLDSIIGNSNNFYLLPSDYFYTLLNAIKNAFIIQYSTCSVQILRKVNKTGNYILYEYVDHIDPEISGGCTAGCELNYQNISSLNTIGVITTAKALHNEMLQRFAPYQVLLNPNGVSTKHFKVEKNNTHLSYSFRKIIERGNKIVGYYGAIAPWLDYKLIADVADKLKDYDFIFLGPLYSVDEKDLPQRDNIFWYGGVDYQDLPNYAVWFDCCYIPFKEGQIAATTSPLKLFEYFALQKPVVVTSYMNECVSFSNVFSSDNADGIKNVIIEAINNWSDNDREKSHQLALENDWEKRGKDYVSFIKTLEKNNTFAGKPINFQDLLISIKGGEQIVYGSAGYHLTNTNEEINFSADIEQIVKGSKVCWEIHLPELSLPKAGVLSFQLNAHLSSDFENTLIGLSFADETFNFLPYPSNGFKEYRVKFNQGNPCIKLWVELEETTFFIERKSSLSIKNISIFPEEAPVFCNHTPLIRESKQEESGISVLKDCNISELRFLHTSSPIQSKQPNEIANISPIEILLSELPKTAEVAELHLDCTFKKDIDSSIELHITSPHFNPEQKGKVFYYIAVDAKVIYFEDIVVDSGLRKINLPLPLNKIQLGVFATNKIGNWKWGDASKVQVFDVILIKHKSRSSDKTITGNYLEKPTSVSQFLTNMIGNIKTKKSLDFNLFSSQ